MPGVSIPGQPSGGMGSILPMAGGVVGGMFGGPGGAAVGSKLGQAATAQGSAPAAVQGADNGPDALSRRLQTQQFDPETQLAQADAALQQLPPEYAQTYGSTIAAARQAAAQGA